MTGAFGSPTVPVTATIPVSTLAGLSSGTHTVYVRGQDSLGNWGAFSFATLTLDKTGPTTRGLVLSPAMTNAWPSSTSPPPATTARGQLQRGGRAVHRVDGACPAALAPCSASVNGPAPVAGLSASLPASYVTLLAVGPHPIAIRSQDVLGNWGAWATTSLTINRSGPVTSGVSATPSPNNGTVPLDATNAVVRVTATFTDAATVMAAEGFIDTVGANGSGFPFIPKDGSFDGSPENGYADIPLTTVNALSSGSHTLYVHGKDAAGNWGATATTVLVIDRTAPSFTGVTLNPATAIVGETVTLTAIGGADIAAGQYWIDGSATPPANPIGFAGATTTFGAPAGGVHAVYARVRDAAWNWTAVRSATLTVPSAVNDTVTITANNNSTPQTSNQAAPGVLGNDLPVGAAGRTATLASGPVRTSGTGTGTIQVTCPPSTTPGVCTTGSYRVTLTPAGNSGAARAASKRGTYQFTYTETLNGKTTPPATVTITVN